MRSARILLATAAAAAALSFVTPGAVFAVSTGDDGGRDDSSYSRDKDSDSGGGRDKGSGGDHDNDYSTDRDSGGSHDSPRGGMHTGGGALAAVRGDDDWSSSSDDSRFDPETYKNNDEDKGGNGGKGDKGDKGDSGKGDKEDSDWGGGGGGDDEDKPRGGMHTGGGALATPGVTAGGLAVLAVGATGMYALRRKKATEPAS